MGIFVNLGFFPGWLSGAVPSLEASCYALATFRCNVYVFVPRERYMLINNRSVHVHHGFLTDWQIRSRCLVRKWLPVSWDPYVFNRTTRGRCLDSTSHVVLSHPERAQQSFAWTLNGSLISLRTTDHISQSRDTLITDNCDLFLLWTGETGLFGW